MNVRALPSDLIGTTRYSSQTGHVTYDVAYDMWLSHSATTTPCQSDGTVEVMVWTDYNRRALLPDSLKVGTAAVPLAVNGIANRHSNAWSVYVSNIGRGGHTAPRGGTVWFVLNHADTVSGGIVSVDLSAVLSDVGTLLQRDYGWTSFRENYWLDSIPFGMEFGPENGVLSGAGPTDFSFNVSSYCLEVEASPSTAAC